MCMRSDSFVGRKCLVAGSAIVSLVLAASPALAQDGIWLGHTALVTEHVGAGAPEYPPFAIYLPMSNWTTFNVTDADNGMSLICVEYAFTQPGIGENGWPVNGDYDGVNVTVIATHGVTGKKLAKLVLKYKDGNTGQVCKKIKTSKLRDASSVNFAPTVTKARSTPGKVFMKAWVYKDIDADARLSGEAALIPPRIR